MMDNRVTWQEVEQAAKDAVRHHMNKDFVQDFCFYWEENLSFILAMILDGSYVEHIAYRQLVKRKIINSCGYIFKGSTNMMEYIEDFHNQSSLQQSF